MHIAFYTNTYSPVISGVVQSIKSYRDALANLGHNVFIFAQNEPDYEDRDPFIFRYPALDLGLPNEVPAIIPVSNCLDRILPALKLDVIHSHHPVLMGQTAANKAEKLNLPLVFTFHSQYQEYSQYFPLSQEIVQEFLQNVIETWLADYMRRCHHIVVPTESMREIVEREYGLRSNTTVLPTGIDVKRYSTPDRCKERAELGWGDETVLISVGRLAREKNWTTLVKAYSQVHQSHPNTRLVILGEGEERKTIEQFAKSNGLEKKIELVGKVEFDQVPCYLRAADLFCFASMSETQGLVTLEALAAGLPVVATAGTGTRDVVKNGREGLLTPNDNQALAEAIIRVLDNPDEMEQFRQAAAQKAAEYDIHVLAERLLEVYAEAWETKKAGRFVEVESHDNSLLRGLRAV